MKNKSNDIVPTKNKLEFKKLNHTTTTVPTNTLIEKHAQVSESLNIQFP